MAVAKQAVERLVGSYRAWATNGASRAPAWLKDLREAGISRFGELGFPTTKQEEWRFTSVAALVETAFPLAEALPHARQPAPALVQRFLLGDGPRLVFVNGHFSAGLSRVAGLPAGVRVENLTQALAASEGPIREHLSKHVAQDHPFAALNTAFVHVPARTVVAEPIQVLYLAAPGAPFVAHPRSLFLVEREARAAIVETYAASEEGAYWTNAVTEIVAADGARVDNYRVQREGGRAYHVAVTHARQGRDSTVNLHAVAFGGALARHDVRGTMTGTGGYLILNGLYLLAGTQHVDHHTTIDHAAPHCESHEYFNGVLDDRARGVFNGRIIVRPGAQKTDSKQTNNNLLLSGQAHADSQPQLEIYADDVKCTHGSTVGPIDPKALFYLESRGLGELEARRLLTYGFAAEILGRMAVAPLREQLDGIVRARLEV